MTAGGDDFSLIAAGGLSCGSATTKQPSLHVDVNPECEDVVYMFESSWHLQAYEFVESVLSHHSPRCSLQLV